MTIEQLLLRMTTWLGDAEIPFMLTGSFASTRYGSVRSTVDVDLVVDPTPAQLNALVSSMLDEGMYVSPDAAEEALRLRSMFNVVDPDTGWKADLIVRKERSFSVTEFSRRQQFDFRGNTIPVATVEDVILSKLEWSKLGGSHRQLEDARMLVEANHQTLDFDYLERWMAQLGVVLQWEQVRGAG